VKKANKGRDEQIEEEVARVKSAQQQNGKQLARLLDPLEADEDPDGALVARMRQKQTAEKELKVRSSTSNAPSGSPAGDHRRRHGRRRLPAPSQAL
jgi:hypothetical protein